MHINNINLLFKIKIIIESNILNFFDKLKELVYYIIYTKKQFEEVAIDRNDKKVLSEYIIKIIKKLKNIFYRFISIIYIENFIQFNS